MNLLVGDCREVLASMDADSVDAVVTDPPYELGFMGKSWDSRGIAFDREVWAGMHRVLKPGGRLLAFGGSRTHHRIWCAIEDAGFVIEDTIMWLYGSGFPKHKSKLKPAFEPVCVARKGGVSELNIDAARIGTTKDVPASVSKSKTLNAYGKFAKGGIADGEGFDPNVGRWPANVCLSEEAAAMLDEQSGERPVSGAAKLGSVHRAGTPGYFGKGGDAFHVMPNDSGGASRFFYTAKANRNEREFGLEGHPAKRSEVFDERPSGDFNARMNRERKPVQRANHHPTVKPVDLMRWLVRLVTLPGQTVLDPFTGSGTTGVACVAEGRRFIGIEQNEEYAEIARRRIAAQQPVLDLGA